MIKSVLYTLTLVAVFSPPIDIKHYIVQHTQSVSVPIRHPSDKESIFTSFETDIYIHRKYKIPGTYIRGILMCACGVCGLFSWSMAAGLLAFSSRQFALTIKHGPSLCPLHTIFPS